MTPRLNLEGGETEVLSMRLEELLFFVRVGLVPMRKTSVGGREEVGVMER